MEQIAALLIAAHFIGDFLFQPKELATRKTEFRYLFLHSAIHGALAYFALQAWQSWVVPFSVLALHTCIDGFKQRWEDTATVFTVDQVAHVFSLFGLAWLLDHFSFQTGCSDPIYKFLIALGGFAVTVKGAGYLVGRFVKPILDAPDQSGLPNGGTLIGQLERSLIFLLIFIGQAAGIGFLVAAKSILRFGEAKEGRKVAEYVLVGTLLSFSLAIALTSATRWAISLPHSESPASSASGFAISVTTNTVTITITNTTGPGSIVPTGTPGSSIATASIPTNPASASPPVGKSQAGQ